MVNDSTARNGSAGDLGADIQKVETLVIGAGPVRNLHKLRKA
jgi:hypothetical protein